MRAETVTAVVDTATGRRSSAGVAEAGEPLREERAESREARADEGDVCFDDGEGGYGGVVEGCVGRVCDDEEGVEANYRDDADAGCVVKIVCLWYGPWGRIGGSEDELTYTAPKAKTPINSAFCFLASLRRRTTGIGRVMIAKSVMMLTMALANHEANVLMHLPSIVGRQNLGMGVQTKMQARTVAMVYAMMTTMNDQVQIWKRRVVKTR
jgi:hypothetical protein